MRDGDSSPEEGPPSIVYDNAPMIRTPDQALHQMQISPSHTADPNRRRSSTMHQFNPNARYDQFDEFLYKSQHIGSANVDTLGVNLPCNPPEVNIEVPSDSDSSRRPSKASFGAQTISTASSYNNFDDSVIERSPRGSPRGSRRESVSAEPPMEGGPKRGAGARRASTQIQNHPSLLAARPVLDRRSSHTGVLFTRFVVVILKDSLHTS